MSKLTTVTSAALFAAGTLLADFHYQQSTKITGGALQAATRMAGAFSRQVREPIVSDVYVKGNRMAHVNPHRAEVFDLDKETITSIDFDRKTYSTMTFAQMKQMMEDAMARARNEKAEGAENLDVNFKATVKDTKQTREISGLNTRDYILTLVMEGSDRKTGQRGAMNITSDLWMAPEIKGYQEVRDFQMRMAQKLGSAIGGSVLGAMGMARSDMMKGMAETAKEMAKMKGVPVLTVTRMGSMPDGSALPAASEAPEAAQTKGPDTKSAASSAAAGALGRLGGLGGLSRRGRNQEDAASKDSSADSRASGPAILMETTTESSGFSSAAVDPSNFEVPAGFKQTDPESRRGRR